MYNPVYIQNPSLTLTSTTIAIGNTALSILLFPSHHLCPFVTLQSALPSFNTTQPLICLWVYNSTSAISRGLRSRDLLVEEGFDSMR